ncbi:LSM domain-containing protein [Tieghemostelium lacteum]|uniref:U6 snRNA-associated Sm-like protein LSm8 n=1 Tax=Tieghemostelium lacteum TaxID=361077 RepID=A0A151ZB00_TIELA|nr:LSM domain-containing protein [Tieghemostelium lacteum]|eukprot:KYQ91123.1 LSM domain-containing protein [Tieghemostelium lacteum]
MSLLEPYIKKNVLVLTYDGRNLVGVLRGIDQAVNIILESCHERIYSEEGIQKFPLGVHIIRGDDVAVVGEIDKELDDKLDLPSIVADPLKPIVY